MAFSFEKLKSPSYFAENRCSAHSDHRWFPSEQDKALGTNSLKLSLNGIWKFAYAENNSMVPVGFEAEDYDCHCWGEITVPAHIQMEGYGVPQYANVQYPWDGMEEVAIGEIPEKINPVACYTKYFSLPAEMQGRKTILSFQGVERCVAVWLNGVYIGFSSNSFSPCEFDLTAALKPGENKLACRVYKWCSGSWMEDQDFYRFSGIYRDVFIYALPEVHVRDLKVESELSDDYRIAKIHIQGSMVKADETAGWKAEVMLDGSTARIIMGTGELLETEIEIENPKLWSAENPCLYTLMIKLYDMEDRKLEIIDQKLGIRRFELINGIMCINGSRIVFNGVNRHDFSADTGRAVTTEMIRRDLVTMKRNNINALRTSHYPNHGLLYELCDELGIYMIAENNMETHGTWMVVESGDKPAENVLPGDCMEWEPMMIDRVDTLYHTCKNHPSILIWSLGNESYGGSVIAHMADEFRKLDSSRLIHYEGVFHDRRYSNTTSDMESQMYTTVADIKKFLSEHREKPFICCEYAHAMGNSCGGMQLYTELTEAEPLYQGGFIWDFIDQAIRGKDRYGNTCYYYGGDLGDRPTDYAFSGNGICTSDGKESIKMPAVKYNYQPVGIFVSENQVTLRNRHLFTNTQVYDAVVTVERNGHAIHKTVLSLAVEPLTEKSFDLPIPEETIAGEYAVTVSLVLKADTEWARAGYEVAFGQYVYRKEGRKKAVAGCKPHVVHGWYNTGVTGDGFSVLFSNLDGGLTSYRYGGREMIKTIPMPNFWRPMVENDFGGLIQLRCAQWKVGSQFVSPRQAGDNYNTKGCIPTVEEKDDTVKVAYTYHMPTVPVSSCKVVYTVHGDGTVDCRMDYNPVKGLAPMPEFGMIFKIDADYDRLEWYGMGPGESYADRTQGTRLGIWKDEVKNRMANHLRPQEAGEMMGVRWVKVTDYLGRGLMFTGDGMNFSALPWTPHEIDCAQHPYELPPIHYTVLRPALAQMGIGGDDTWGSVPHPEYWLDETKERSFTFSFKGCTRA